MAQFLEPFEGGFFDDRFVEIMRCSLAQRVAGRGGKARAKRVEHRLKLKKEVGRKERTEHKERRPESEGEAQSVVSLRSSLLRPSLRSLRSFAAIQFRIWAALVPSFMPGCAFAPRRGGFSLVEFTNMTTGSHWHRLFWSAIFAVSIGASALGAEPPITPPGLTAAVRFQTNSIEGWRVLVNERLLADDQTVTEKALGLLRGQLQEIVRVVPAPAVAKLREVTLWFSPEYPGVKPRAEYHPGADWLRDNGRDPVMAKGVEFTDVRNFEAETKRMPNFTLHELAHGYHDRVLPRGFDHAEIKAAYERAKASKSYDKVERWFGNGRANTQEKAYAMTSPMEYFAETTEAFFSRNDFFPFTREDLKQHDPEMEQLLVKLWGVTK